MSHDVKQVFGDIDLMEPDRFVRHLDPDVVFRFGNNPAAIGRAAVREAVTGFFTTIAGMRHDVLALHEDGEVVTVRADVTYTRTDGGIVTVPNADILTFGRDGLVQDWQIFIDLAPVFA